MKTLKFIGLALLAIVMCVNFTACSNDDDNANTTNNLEGTWFLIQTKYDLDGSMETFDPSNLYTPKDGAEQWTFMKSTNQPNIYNVQCRSYNSDDNIWESDDDYYIYDSKTNRITSEEDNDYGEIIKLTNNQLTIKWQELSLEGVPGETWTSVYTRINK